MAGVAYRAAVATDRAAIRGLAHQDLGGTPYIAVLDYFLRLAFEGVSDEARAIVAERGHDVVGVALFGEIAGALGTGRMHFIGVTASARLHAIGLGLCEAAVANLATRKRRLVIAEVPDDPLLSPGRALLARGGFVETARVTDYYRDGIDLIVLQRSIDLLG